MSDVQLIHGDCLDVLRTLPDASVDAVVTDPPYGLGFMGKAWDNPDRGAATRPRADGDHTANPYKRSRAEYGGASYGGSHLAAMCEFGAWCELWTAECLRVLKPGGHLLAFGGTRTWHRLACAVEDAGFEVRDSIAWMYGSGFPKSLDVSKAIDKAAGAEREVVGPSQYANRGRRTDNRVYGEATPSDAEVVTLAATPDAERWQGFGTALKPAFEPVVVARKPLVGTVASNVLAHGTGALNIDGCRIEGGERPMIEMNRRQMDGSSVYQGSIDGSTTGSRSAGVTNAGRWPANVILDESQSEALDQMSGERPSGQVNFGDDRARTTFDAAERSGPITAGRGYDDLGGASRFFYIAKADASERVKVNGIAHPTVKPLALMRWLVRLVTPPGGTVLEPFAGSGTTVEACILEGFNCVAIEREADYLPLIRQRIARRRDPVEAVRGAGEDGGLFDLLDGGAA